MYSICARNVRRALHAGIDHLHTHGVRDGNVIVAPHPVTTAYERPWERVLIWPERDANPFFHLFEAMWMLVGRRDVKFLNHFIKDFGDRFGETNGYEHDAYGYRWRYSFGFDQLEVIVDKLRVKSNDRQTVIQMWDATSINNDLRGDWKTRPCNICACPRVHDTRLDLTVFCRSNDIIWGAYGANAVQFSVLQEYLAARLGVDVGIYYQVSNNFHAYLDVWEKLVDKAEAESVYPATRRMITHPDLFDRELNSWFRAYDRGEFRNDLKNRFISYTMTPMAHAFNCWRAKDGPAALKMAQTIEANDWREACVQWIIRREHARISSGPKASR
jgi:thymidylate synthase